VSLLRHLRRDLQLYGGEFSSRLTIEASRKCDIVVLNRDAYLTLRSRGIGRRVYLIPNPIRDEFFKIQPYIQGFNIVYVGRLSREKGVFNFG